MMPPSRPDAEIDWSGATSASAAACRCFIEDREVRIDRDLAILEFEHFSAVEAQITIDFVQPRRLQRLSPGAAYMPRSALPEEPSLRG